VAGDIFETDKFRLPSYEDIKLKKKQQQQKTIWIYCAVNKPVFRDVTMILHHEKQTNNLLNKKEIL